MTGYSSRPVGISEKFWNWSDYRGDVASSGYPWHYLLRDILEFDRDATDALNRMFAAKRCDSLLRFALPHVNYRESVGPYLSHQLRII